MPGYADPSPTYQPAMRLITDITNAVNAEVTTSFAHDYLSGLVVRIIVPEGYGMVQINQLVGTITVTGDDTFTIDIDTTQFDPFVIPGSIPYYFSSYPQTTPIGEQNSILYQATRNVL